jgi:hypothetical protein
MRSWASRLAAASALVAVLACSGLGLCWRQIARDGHDCCSNDGVAATSTSSKACASVVAAEASAKVLAPAMQPMTVTHHLLLSFRGAPLPEGFAPRLPPKAAPLVLRL